MPEHATPRYQADDEQPRTLWMLAAGFVVALTAGGLLSAVARDAYTPDRAPKNPAQPTSGEVQSFPEPRLLSDEVEALQLMREEEARLLESWAWVDRERGIARIPVDRAALLLLEIGLPARRAETRKDK